MTVMLRRTIVAFLTVFVGLQISQPAWGQDDEKDRLQGEIARLQKAFDYFREERDQLKIELEKETQKNDQLKTRLKRFAEALEKNRKVVAVYKKKLSSMAGTPDELQKKLDRANAQIVVLEASREKLADQIKLVQNGLIKEQRLRKAQEKMTQDKELAAHEAEVQAEAASRKVVLLEAERDKLLSEIDALNTKTEKDYAGYLTLEERLEAFERKADEDSATIQNGLAQIVTLKDALDKADKEYAALQQELGQKEADYSAKLRKASGTLKKMEALKEAKAEAEAQLDAVKAELKEEQQARRSLEKTGQQFEQESVELQTKYEEAKRNLQRYEDEREQLLADVDVFEKALEEERARRQVQEDLARRMKNSGNTVQRDLETLRLKLANAVADRDAAEEKQQKLQDSLDTLMLDRRAGSKAIDDLQFEFDDLKMKYERVQAEFDQLETKSKNALKNVALLKKALARERKLRMDRENFSSELEALQDSRENEMDELTVRLTEVQAAYRDSAKKSNMLKESLVAERKRSAELTAALEKEKEQRERVSDALAQQDALLEKARVEGMDAGRKDMATKLSQQSKSSKELQQQVEQLKEDLQAERQRGYEMAQLDLNEKIASLNDQLERTVKQVKTLESELVEQKELLASERRTKSEGADKESRKAIAKLEDQLRKQRGVEERLREELRERPAATVSDNKQIKTLKRDLSDEQKKRKKIEKASEQLRMQLAAREKSVEELKAELAEKTALVRRQQLQLKQRSAVVGAVSQPMSSSGSSFGSAGSEAEVVVEAETETAATTSGDEFTELEAVLADMDVKQEVDQQQAQAEKRKKALAELDTRAERAFRLYSDGKVMQAREILDEVLQQDPTRVDALGVRGVIAWQEGNMDEAVVLLEKALALDDSNSRAHNYMGIVQNSLQNQERAEKEFRKAIQLDANYEEPLFNLAVVIATGDQTRTDEARKYYERSLLLGSTRNENLEEILYP